jgi:anti-anti-sigma factor
VSELLSVQGDDFNGAARQDGTRIVTNLKGNADYAAIEAVEQLLDRTHAEATRTTTSEVVIDVRQLEFMNSSCFKVFVSWITEIQELPEAQQYKVRFQSNPQLHWQKRSLHSLRCFAVELITVEEHG